MWLDNVWLLPLRTRRLHEGHEGYGDQFRWITGRRTLRKDIAYAYVGERPIMSDFSFVMTTFIHYML